MERFVSRSRLLLLVAASLIAGACTRHATEEPEAPEKEVFRFVPVTVTCRDDGRTAWQPAAQAGTRFIFEITDEKAYPEAMVKALAELMFAL